MNGPRKPLSIDSSAITVAGIGGIGMIALVAIIAAAFPIARWLLSAGVVGGAILASVLILCRRSRQIGGPRGDLPIALFSTELRRSGPAEPSVIELPWRVSHLQR